MAESASLHAYGYLTQTEVRFLDAAVERLIPTDELGPGARDAGVTCYIDRQLCSVWGTHGRHYRSGPWLDGTPEEWGYRTVSDAEEFRSDKRFDLIIMTGNAFQVLEDDTAIAAGLAGWSDVVAERIERSRMDV